MFSALLCSSLLGSAWLCLALHSDNNLCLKLRRVKGKMSIKKYKMYLGELGEKIKNL